MSSSLQLPGTASPIRNVAAPMVAASDYPFRCLCRQHGVDLSYTQMLHAKNLVGDKMFQKNHLDLLEYSTAPVPLLAAQQNFLGSQEQGIDNGEDKLTSKTGPLIVQLAGNNVDLVVRAANLILEQTDGQIHGIDLNLGCPQGIARKGNYGAFLIEQEEDLVYRVLHALRNELPESTAVSAKIRLPANGDDVVLRERIHRFLDTGIDYLTIHGRTLHENKTKVGPCNWDKLALAIKEANLYRPGFPVVANGGVELFSDVSKLQESTGAAAIMSSEALLERPNVFSVDSSQFEPRLVLEQQFQFARDYLSWCRLYPPLPGVLGHVGGSCNMARGHLFKFLHRYLTEQPDMRERLASHHLITLAHLESFVSELYERYEGRSDEELARSGHVDASWYRRHWSSRDMVHQRSINSVSPASTVSVTSLKDRKDEMKLRIAKLKVRRLEKQSGV
jgi:tRNA-dihydrouridine synthase